MKLPSRIALFAGFALALLLLAFVGYASFESVTGLIGNNARAAHSAEVLDNLDDLVQALIDDESISRGFAMSGDVSMLQGRPGLVRIVYERLRNLRRLTADNRVQQQWLDELEGPAVADVNWHTALIDKRRAAGLGPAVEMFNTLRGVQLMANVRRTIKAMDSEERRLLASRTERAERSASAALETLAAGGAVALILLVVVYAYLVREIGRRIRAQSTLQHQTEVLKSVLDSMGDAVLVSDREGNLLLTNPAAQRIFGPVLSSPLGEWAKKLGLLMPDRATPEAPERLTLLRSLNGEEVNNSEAYMQSSGTGPGIWIRSTGRALRDEAGNIAGAVVVTRDVTENKLAHESEVRKLNRELEHRVVELTAVNHELDSFSYSVSHDLRAPLRQIDGFSRILLEEAPNLSEQSRHYLDRIREGATKMGRMVDELLRLSRLGRQELKLEPVALDNLLRESLEVLKPDTQGREIAWTVAPLPVALGDPVLLKVVFTNLLANAIKFTQTRVPAEIEVGSRKDGRREVIFVRDNGVGFDMKYADKLFGVFQRLHRREEFEGTGVGLATVQRIVHRHGGDVWAEAEPGKGATFYFTLELPEREAAGSKEV